MSQEMIDDFKRINDLIYAKGLALGSAEYFVVREICCKHTKTVSTEEHALKLTQVELDYCYEHSHGNTPYTKAKAYGRMIEKAVHAKYAARDAEAAPVAWMFPDDEEQGYIAYQGKPPTQEQVDYLAKWNRPTWIPLFTHAPAPVAVPDIDYFKAQSIAAKYGLDYNKFCAGLREMLPQPPKEEA